MIKRVRKAIQHAELYGTDRARAAIEAMRQCVRLEYERDPFATASDIAEWIGEELK